MRQVSLRSPAGLEHTARRLLAEAAARHGEGRATAEAGKRKGTRARARQRRAGGTHRVDLDGGELALARRVREGILRRVAVAEHVRHRLLRL